MANISTLDDDSNPFFNNPDLLQEIEKTEKDDRLLIQAGIHGALNPDLFIEEQISHNVPEAISGNRKDYSWNKLLEDDKFLNIMKDFYEIRDGEKFNYSDGDTQEENDLRNKQDIVDTFIWDRTWKQSNVSSILNELVYVKGLSDEDVGPKQKKENIEQMQRMLYAMNYWQNLPWFKDRTKWDITKRFGHNLLTGTLDWTNIGSLGVGMWATKTAGKQAAAQLVKFTVQDYLKKYAGKTISPMVAFDMAAMGTADIMAQNTQIEMGIKENIDYNQTGKVVIVAGGISLPISSAAGFYGTRYSLMVNRKIPANTLITSAESKISNKPIKIKSESMFSAFDRKIQGVFDRYNPAKIFQKKITGVEPSVLGAKKIITQKPGGVFKEHKGFTTIIDDEIVYGPARDVASLGYIQLRLTVGATKRGEIGAKSDKGIYMLPNIGDLKYYYKQTGNPGLNAVLKEFIDVGEGENFLVYIAAKRALREHELNYTSPEGFIPFVKDPLEKNRKFLYIPFTKEEARAVIDRAEMSASAYKTKYGIPLDRTILNKHGTELNFINGLSKWKAYTDDLLDIQYQSGILGADDVSRIKATYTNGYIPYYKKVIEEHITNKARANNISGIGAPGKKKTTRGPAKQIAEGDAESVKIHSLYENAIDYHFNSIIASEKNRAKVLYYQMIRTGIQNGTFTFKKVKTKKPPQIIKGLEREPDKLLPHGIIFYGDVPIMKVISPVEVKMNTILEKNVISQLEKNGYKIEMGELNQNNPNIQAATFSSTIRDGSKLIDVVYYNGKPQFIEIIDPGLVSMYAGKIGQEFLDKHPAFAKFYKGVTYFTTIPSKMITLSPRFAARTSIFRDTFTATVNSAFGFIPLWSSLKGLFLTNKGLGSLLEQKAWYKKLTGIFERSAIYDEFLANGGGMTTRNQTTKVFAPKWEKHTDVTGTVTKDYKISTNYFKKIFSKGADGWIEFIARMEYASRLAEYSYAKKVGFSPVMASFAGREISTDFAMHGSYGWLQRYSENTMFFNAGLQGFYKMLRAVKDNPYKAGTIVGGIFVAPEIAMWTMLNGRDEYEELSNEVKMMNFVYPIFKDNEFDDNGELVIDHFVLIPKPFDYGFAPNVAIAILEAVKRNDFGGGVEYTLSSFQKIMPGFTTPTALNPIVSVLRNQSWQGDKIVPDYMLSQIPEAQKTVGTSLTALQISNGIKWLSGKGYAVMGKPGLESPTFKPIIVDFMLNSYMAGVGQIALDLSDAFWYEGAEIGPLKYSGKRYEYTEDGEKIDILGEKPKARGDRIDLINDPMSFVTSAFKIETPIKNNKRVNFFFDKVNRLKKLKVLYPNPKNDRYIINNYVELLVGDAQHKLENESLEMKELREAAPYLESGLIMARVVKDEKKLITNNPDLSADQKRDQIREKDALLAETIRVILESVREANFETLDQTLFANPDMTAENVKLGNTREIIEKSTDTINDAVQKAIEQSKELFQ